MKQYIIILFCTFFGSMASLQAANGPWLESEYAKVRLISSTQATGNLEQIPAALEFQLKPDWKVYWRSPGDAGLPPILVPCSGWWGDRYSGLWMRSNFYRISTELR